MNLSITKERIAGWQKNLVPAAAMCAATAATVVTVALYVQAVKKDIALDGFFFGLSHNFKLLGMEAIPAVAFWSTTAAALAATVVSIPCYATRTICALSERLP